MMYNDVDIQAEIFLFISIISISFIGTLCKSYYNLLAQHKPMRIGIIVISTITSSIVVYVLSDILIHNLSFHVFIGVTFFTGVIGIEIVKYLSNFSKLLLMIRILIFRNPADLTKLLEDDSKPKENDNATNITISIKRKE